MIFLIVFILHEMDGTDINIPIMEKLIYLMLNMNLISGRLKKDVAVRYAAGIHGRIFVIY